MSETNLHIQYQGIDLVDTSQDIWINLEQADLPVYGGNVSLNDILNMSTIARQQETAFSYRMDDGIYFSDSGDTINIPLSFYVFPSSMGLSYSLQIPQGELSDRVVINLAKTGNVVVPLSTSVSFKALVNNVNLTWQTPCYNEHGNILSAPNYTVSNNKIELDNQVFGVLRGSFNYIGYKYTLTLSFTKAETAEEHPFTVIGLKNIINTQTNYNSITNIQTTVICTYMDENGEEQQESLDLQIPKSAEMYLSDCPNGASRVVRRDEKEMCHTIYYYSVCDGSIIHTERSEGCAGTI